jgi:hypothetical protein
VDFAFKLVFGSPDHTRVTVHFLNAVLILPQPITSVEILNPIQGREFSEDKLVVLDVLATDALGRRFNVEMQTTLPIDLPKRLTYYNCLNYIRQLSAGEPYYQLRPAISICVLEKWLYFLKHAAQFEASELADRLADAAYREATGVLEMISQSPEERQYYEARMKFLHDEQARLLAAREEGLEQGLEQGLIKGRAERLERGSLVGKIQLLQQLLGEDESSLEELRRHDPASLVALLAELQSRLRSRGA